MKWFRADRRYGYGIKEFDVTRATDKVVFLNNGYRECRENKVTDYYHWFPTMAEALDFQITKAQRDLERAKRETNTVNSELHQLIKRRQAIPPESNSDGLTAEGSGI